MSHEVENPILYRFVDDTPVGRLLLAADASGLRFLHFVDGPIMNSRPLPPIADSDSAGETWHQDDGELNEPVQQLRDWFAGDRKTFDLPLAPQGTEFQRKVWSALQEIPWGNTWSYGQLAKHIGQPTASRAVGLANGRNPISIMIPCHRVIGSSGQLTGYGGGLENKQALLQLEGSWPPADNQPSLFDKYAADESQTPVAGTTP